MKISLSFILNRIATNLVFYQEERKGNIFLLDQIYFFEQSVDNSKVNNIERMVGNVFENFDLSKFDSLNEKIKSEKKSDFAERPLFQIKHLAEFYNTRHDQEVLSNLFSELDVFYNESKPTKILLDHYRHIGYNQNPSDRLSYIGCLNYFTQSLHNNYLDLMYRQDGEALEKYSQKFNDALTKFYNKSKELDDETQKQITNIVMIGMGIKQVFETVLNELIAQNNNQTIQYTALFFAMLFAQLPLYFLENQNDILIKSIESLKDKDEDAIEILNRLYKLRVAINQTKSIQGFAYIFEKIGIEVEEIVDSITKFYQILLLNVVEITNIEKHPQSDRLNLCTIFDGYETKEIVCGAQNVHNIKDNGLKTILANLGHVIPCDMLLEPREIRGIVSQGMLCSLDELCLDYPENEVDGITELQGDAIVGQSPLSYILKKFNFSVIFDISITPNLGSYLGLYNLEDVIFSYITSKHHSYVTNHLLRLERGDESAKFDVKTDKIIISDDNIANNIIENIYFYECEDVTKYNGTHFDVQNLLKSHGFDIHNNIMDGVNFAHIMIGAYPHAIDCDKINGKLKIKFNDKKLGDLNESDIVIVDEDENLVAVPGLYDNPDYKLNEKTTKKCLFFFIIFKDNPDSNSEIGFNKMLQIARRKRLSNDMIYFYERGRINEAFIKSIFSIISTDYSTNEIHGVYCINDKINQKQNWFKPVKMKTGDIMMLYKEIGVLNEVDNLQHHESPTLITDQGRVSSSSAAILGMLGIIDFNLNENPMFDIGGDENNNLYCILPVYVHRIDINTSLDLVNEVSKFTDFYTNQNSLMEGFYEKFVNNSMEYDEEKRVLIEPFSHNLYKFYHDLFSKKIDSTYLSEYYLMEQRNKLQQILINRGFHEICNFSFIDKNHAEIDENQLVSLSSPVNQNLNILRPSIIPSLLNNLVEIIKQAPENVSIFECGPVYIKENIFERNITGLLYGVKFPRNHYINSKAEFDFFDIKADFLKALEEYNIYEDDLNFVRIDDAKISDNHSIFMHPGKSAIVYFGDIILGYLGEIHPKILKKYDISKNVVAFTIIVESLEEVGMQEKKSLFQSVYQEVNRDLAFFFDENISVKEIKNAIWKSIEQIEDKILQEVNIFDIYQDEKLKEENKKSIGINFKLQSKRETLSDKIINKTIDAIITGIKSDLSGILTIDAE